MSDVKRWKLKGFIPGVDGESKAVFQPTVVLAEDYDAALAREAALREELSEKTRILNNSNYALCELGEILGVDEDDQSTPAVIALAKLIQQRLTVAEQRAAFLERVMRDTLNDEDGLFITAEFNTGPTWSALQKHGRSIEAALKPAAEGENHG